MILRPHQIAPVHWIASKYRGIVVSPAGSGKTLISAAALATVLESKIRSELVNVGWMANTIEQCNQAREALAQFDSIAELANVRVACAAAQTDWSDCDLLICDEIHHGASPSWRSQIETCQGARWGFTATPDSEGDDAETRAAILAELFGNERFIVERAEVGSLVTKAVVELHEASDPGLRSAMDAEIVQVFNYRSRYWSGDPGKLRAMVSWQILIEMGIVGNRARNDAAAELVARHRGESVLVLVNQVEHAKQFAERVGGVACHSGMGAKKRRAALESFKAGELKCIVATSLADEGLDLPRASVLVLVSGGRNKAKAEQRTGRVLRQFAGKDHAKIYDFSDRFHPLMARHSEARQAVYKSLGYEVTFAK